MAISDNIDKAMNVSIRPQLLKWARERASLSSAELGIIVGTKLNPAPIDAWEQADEPIVISSRKLETVAKKTRTPFGMFFLIAPPEEVLPIADFRRTGATTTVSLNLLDTVHETQLRQSWLSDALKEDGEDPLSFV